jgi:hypothetical protein
MYDSVMEVYPFPSVIFTTYMLWEDPHDIIRFCGGKDNIRVITVPADREEKLAIYAERAEGAGLLIYTHTLNRFDDIAAQRQKGVYGLYTDYLLPADFALYESLGPAIAQAPALP